MALIRISPEVQIASNSESIPYTPLRKEGTQSGAFNFRSIDVTENRALRRLGGSRIYVFCNPKYESFAESGVGY
ncbi:hypothetical protein D3C71_1930620 [compost metagenome]